MWKSPLAIILCQVGHCALESSIVVGGHLVGNVVIPCVVVLIIAVGASDNSTIEDLWVSCWAVLLGIATWGVRSNFGPDFRPDFRPRFFVY